MLEMWLLVMVLLGPNGEIENKFPLYAVDDPEFCQQLIEDQKKGMFGGSDKEFHCVPIQFLTKEHHGQPME